MRPRLVEVRRLADGRPWFEVPAADGRPGGWTDGHPWRDPSPCPDPVLAAALGRRTGTCATCGARAVEYVDGLRVCTRPEDMRCPDRREPPESLDRDWRAAEAERTKRADAARPRQLRLRERVRERQPR